MNTQQLKELALIWSRSEVACMPIEEFSDLSGTPLEDVRVLFGAANVLDDLIDQLESAERERDELRGKYQEVSGWYAIMKARMSIAEAKLARRDAAAGEPVAYIIKGRFDKENGRDRGRLNWHGLRDRNAEDIAYYNLSATPLYTATQPAVLPPDITFESKGFVSLTSEDFAYNRALEDARKLGAQQQKVVELPEPVKWPEIPFKYFSEEQVFSMLDAAGVKWEVKK